MKLQLHLQTKQVEYQQQYEVMGLLLKNAFGGTEKPQGSAIIHEKIKSLPVLNTVESVKQFFENQRNG
ncbi:hypothetical protein EAb13_CDS0100 [Acinetobacter phage EAb13]|nr:hypothetical protein EAb13_CDS0100 [Acinetobacter phage EAb13]